MTDPPAHPFSDDRDTLNRDTLDRASFDPDTLDPAILAQLVCPACYGDLRLEGAGLLCPACRRAYAIVDGIPVMIVERAERLAEEP